MTALIARFLITPAVLLGLATFVPGIVVGGIYTALIVALLLGVINVTIRPLLLLLTLPINILTFGLLTFVINAGLLLFVASFVDGFAFDGFLPALLTAAVLAVANWFAAKLIR